MFETDGDVLPKEDFPPESQDDSKARMQFRTLVDVRTAPGLGFVQGTARFDKNDGEELHTHQVGETAYVMEGRGTVTLDGTRKEVGPGDMVVAPAGVVHGWKADGGPLEILYSFPVDAFEEVEYRFVDRS